MIKRTIEISREPAHLSVQHRQLVLKRNGNVVGSIPCEDLGMVVVDHPQTTYTHGALSTLLESDAAVVICGRDHLPQGLLLPLAEHTEVVWRIHDQIAAPRPLRKRLWRQLVQEKVLAQAHNLAPGSVPRRKLVQLARQVRSGDPENVEAQAAKIYWSAWLTNLPKQIGDEHKFRRLRDGLPPNSLLNYGYAIVRAAVARALVSAGLLPAFGLHHSNRSNAFCLADDLVEPLRPLVDERARALFLAGSSQLDQPTKAELLDLLTLDVRLSRRDETAGPLMVMLHRYVASLVRCFEGKARTLDVPVRCRRPRGSSDGGRLESTGSSLDAESDSSKAAQVVGESACDAEHRES